MGNANLGLHPEIVQDKIRNGVKKSLQNLKKYKPFKLKSPYTIVLSVEKKDPITTGLSYPGVKQTGEMQLTYTSDNILDIFEAFLKVWN
jgi:D-aminopeptidase